MNLLNRMSKRKVIECTAENSRRYQQFQYGKLNNIAEYSRANISFNIKNVSS